jgi:aspartyl/asparaginyl beta-hydroxylase (cupin superfamily)
MDAGDLVNDAERAISARDLQRAVTLLEQAAELSPDDLTLWMKLAALRRGTGDVDGALNAVHRTLALSPRDFTALLMRASLLQRLGDPKAGEAWANALAQRPDKDMPPELAPIVAEAEQRHAQWLGAREDRMRRSMAAAEARADAEQRKRIDRFRSNVLRRTRPFHSDPTDFYYPELAEREFHPPRLFPWINRLEAATGLISEELGGVMAAERAELVPYVQYDEHLPLDQWKPLNKSSDWTAIHLLLKGKRIEANARHCPRTMELLTSFPQPAIEGAAPNAMFSLLAPNTRIPPHVGVGNFRLVCHLPLIVPEGCWFRAGAETRYWKPGEAFVFDDTIEHEAHNPTDELRVVFIFDVWHPDLAEIEREGIKALIESDDAVAGGEL